jgi:hypothetical protein
MESNSDPLGGLRARSVVHVSTLSLSTPVFHCTLTSTAHDTWLPTASLFSNPVSPPQSAGCVGGLWCSGANGLFCLRCTGVCFARDTIVQVRDAASGRAVPVKIRNVKTGEQILCMDTSDDLRLPTKATWCEVINWVSRSYMYVTATSSCYTIPPPPPHGPARCVTTAASGCSMTLPVTGANKKALTCFGHNIVWYEFWSKGSHMFWS